MTKRDVEILDIPNPITAEEAVAEFLKDPENERLYRDSEIRLRITDFEREGAKRNYEGEIGTAP